MATSKMHKGWTYGQGFEPLRDERNVIQQAKCNECGAELTKRDYYTLVAHSNTHRKVSSLKICTSNTQVPTTNEAPANSDTHRHVPADKSPTANSRIPDIRVSPLAHHVPANNQALGNSQASSLRASPPVQNLNDLDTPPRKRPSLEKQRPDKSASAPCKLDEDVLKFLVSWDRKYEDVNSFHFQKLVKSLCPSYTLPSPETLKELGSRVCQTANKDNSKKSKTHSLWVQKLKIKDQFVLVSAVIGRAGYMYVDYNVICEVHQDDFKKFCTTSCLKVMRSTDIRIYSIIHNTDFECEKIQYCEEYSALLSRSFGSLLDDLTKIEFQTGHATINDITNYYKGLERLKLHLENDPLIAKAMITMTDFFDDQPAHMASETKSILTAFWKPIHYAAMLLYPEHKGYIEKSSYLKTKAHRYLTNAITGFESLDGIAHYTGEIEGFENLFEDLHQLTAEEFWRNARITYKDLSGIAMDLLDVPAIPKLLDPEKLTLLTESDHSESDSNAKLLLLNVLLEAL